MRDNRAMRGLGLGTVGPATTALVVAALAAGGLAPSGGAATSVNACSKTRSGYLVYANGVTCPTAKTIVAKIERLRYRRPKVTVTSIPRYLCVVTYSRRTKKMTAGSCLKRGTTGTGFGWTKGGATVPLPPGAGGS